MSGAYRFTVRAYTDAGAPINPADDERLATIEAGSALEAGEAVRKLKLTDKRRAQIYCRAEVWPFGKPKEKTWLFEPE